MASVSIVIPVYFNEPSLSQLAERLAQVADQEPAHSFEFIYVDDGSGDGSYAVLQSLARQDPRVRVVKLARNFGSNTAILAGLNFSGGDCAAFIAADLQDPPEMLHSMLRAWEAGYRVTLAVRKDRSGDPLTTRLFATTFNWLFSKLIFPGYSPQGIGFFLIDRQVINVLVQSNEKNAHLIGLILWSGFQTTSVEYERVEREHGKSRWTFRKKVKYFIDAFVAFSHLPLRLASTIGLTLAALGSLYAILIIILDITGNVPVQGWSALMVVVLLLSGVQLVMLGVIGEYLWRNFDATRHRPIFIIDRTINAVPGPLHAPEAATTRQELPEAGAASAPASAGETGRQ